MIFLRPVKLYTSCKNFEQTLFKQIVIGDKVLALVHLSLEEVAMYVHRRIFVNKNFLDLHRVDELKNFAANNFLSWLLKSRTGIRAIG